MPLSLLLWVLILSLYGACAVWFGGNLPPQLKARVLSVQAMVAVAFLIRFLRGHSLNWFVGYRLLLAAVVVATLLLGYPV